jgi:hypothetical protein
MLFLLLIQESLDNLLEELRHLPLCRVPALLVDDSSPVLANVLHDSLFQLGGEVEVAQYQQVQPVGLANRRSQHLEARCISKSH